MVLTSCEFGEKGVIFYSSVLPWKGRLIWADKSVFYHKKGVHFELKCQCFIAKKGSFCPEKSVFCCKKGDHFQTGEQGCVPFFPVNEWAGIKSRQEILVNSDIEHTLTHLLKIKVFIDSTYISRLFLYVFSFIMVDRHVLLISISSHLWFQSCNLCCHISVRLTRQFDPMAWLASTFENWC